MPTVTEALTLAKAHLQAGRFALAEQLCRQICQAAPNQVEAWWILGMACQSQGKLQEAVDNLQQAQRLKPAWAEPYYHIGLILKRCGQRDAAISHFQHAVCCNTSYADAIRELEATLAEQQLAAAQPGTAGDSTAANLPKEARRLYGQAHYNLGVVRGLQGMTDAAIGHYRRALRFNPDEMQAHNNLANALSQKSLWAEAVPSYHEALRCKPDCVEALCNLGAALTRLGRLQEAVDYYRRGLQINPNFAEVHNNLGETLRDLGQLDEALACFEKALMLKPDFAEARWNRSLVWLLGGDFERGWPEYEYRWLQPGVLHRSFPQPVWDGSPFKGRTILVHAEQGLGDTLNFIRYLPQVKERGGQVIFECQASLCRLLTGFPGVDLLVARGFPLPAFDLQAPLVSLPRIFRTGLETILSGCPYLHTDPELVDRWRHELAPLTGFKVGIAWQGSPTYRYDRQRSIPLLHFARLAQVESVHLISLQKGPGLEQLTALTGKFPILDLGSRLDFSSGPFMDTAAVMKNLDLVISSDTAVPHLAGALGVPVWVALPLVPDWRWLLQREDSPWYPSMRLFRQTTLGDWPETFARIAAALEGIRR